MENKTELYKNIFTINFSKYLKNGFVTHVFYSKSEVDFFLLLFISFFFFYFCLAVNIRNSNMTSFFRFVIKRAIYQWV